MPAARARFKGAFGSGQMSTKPNIMARLSAPILLSAAHTRSRCTHSSARVSRSTSLSSPLRARSQIIFFYSQCLYKSYDTETKIPFMHSFSGNCVVSVPISTFMCLWAIYVFLGSAHIQYFLELGIYKSLTDTWMWKLGLWPRNSFLWYYFFRIFGIGSLQCSSLI